MEGGFVGLPSSERHGLTTVSPWRVRLGDGYEAFFFAAHSPPDASLGVATDRTGSGSAVILVRTVDLLELNTGPFRVEGLEAVADQDGEKTGPLVRRDYRSYMGRTHLPGSYAGTYGTTAVPGSTRSRRRWNRPSTTATFKRLRRRYLPSHPYLASGVCGGYHFRSVCPDRG